MPTNSAVGRGAVATTWLSLRNALTSDLLERCRDGLPIEEFDRAWAVGPTLSREELTREPEPG